MRLARAARLMDLVGPVLVAARAAPAWRLVRLVASDVRGRIVRHAVAGMLLSLACASSPRLREVGAAALARTRQFPLQDLAAHATMAIALLFWLKATGRTWSRVRLAWMAALWPVAAAEEWVFRFAAPAFLGGSIGPAAADLVCAAAFGAMHRATLAWTWRRCGTTALFGVALAMVRGLQYDLGLLVLLHWAASFASGSGPPRGTSSQSAGPVTVPRAAGLAQK